MHVGLLVPCVVAATRSLAIVLRGTPVPLGQVAGARHLDSNPVVAARHRHLAALGARGGADGRAARAGEHERAGCLRESFEVLSRGGAPHGGRGGHANDDDPEAVGADEAPGHDASSGREVLHVTREPELKLRDAGTVLEDARHRDKAVPVLGVRRGVACCDVELIVAPNVLVSEPERVAAAADVAELQLVKLDTDRGKEGLGPLGEGLGAKGHQHRPALGVAGGLAGPLERGGVEPVVGELVGHEWVEEGLNHVLVPVVRPPLRPRGGAEQHHVQVKDDHALCLLLLLADGLERPLLRKQALRRTLGASGPALVSELTGEPGLVHLEGLGPPERLHANTPKAKAGAASVLKEALPP
mmetsp:Transcript_33439/g.84505  ORF Transcript_33439/g.84505 Transcript_33439/m.84505 type:complete len:357 (-) Transcript_33439:258-1328(-)